MFRFLNPMVVGATVLFAVGGVDVAFAATMTVPVTTQTVLSDSLGHARILIQLGDLTGLRGQRVLYAKCYLDIARDTCESEFSEVEIRPMLKGWTSQTARWADATDSTSLTDLYARHTFLEGGRNGYTEVQLTELVQAWTTGKLAPNGVVLIPADSDCVYSLRSNAEFSGNGYGKLVIRYTPVAP